MTQDMNHTFVKALRAVLVVTLMLLTGSNGLAQTTTQTGVRVNGSVYGGGNLATVGGSVTVNIKAGTIEKDVYGGGALANTNINNASNYGTNSETISSTETNTTTVNLTGGTIKGDAYGGGLGRMAKDGTAAVYTAVENGTHLTAGNKYYTSNAGAGEFTSGGTEVSDGTNYYELTTPAVAGVEAVEAKVYGDINVSLGSNGGSTATAFYIYKYTDNAHKDVVKSGRVFGSNNLNGSPLGNVTVTVWKTAYGNVHRSESANKSSTNATYELAAVYGGGNLANFTTANKKTHVVINGCSDTSIEYVYGGGNAAAVPETDVDINEAYEIGYVFGGGNGKDQYTLDGTTWINNPGANVNGDANTMLTGGVIHEAFGGSNEKGTISGSVSINSQSGGTCDLSVGKLYGAGKNADIEGDLIVILGCMPGDENPTDEVYGGAENANVKGNVELTITSGTFHKVFGGNNTSGAIFGHIKLNIEETGCCPIKIDELYLGGYNAPYSVYGYYENGTIEGTDKPKYVVRQSASDHEEDVVSFTGKPHTVPPYADPELNIISCTRIGKVFGGGLGSSAVIYGNPIVNINQIYGIESDGNGGYTVATTLGAIGGQYTLDGETVDGGVFGGGNQASVIGNTTVNIGTKTKVEMTSLAKVHAVEGDPEYVANTAADQQPMVYQKKTVLGTNIISNVYGGGDLADVGQYDVANDNVDVAGNTYVNIGAKGTAILDNDNKPTGEYNYTVVNLTGIAISGNVFGGGQGEAAESGDGAFKCAKAIVTGGTNIHIGNGTVNGTVYGGGEVGRVEGNSVVAIGIGAGSTPATSAPEIKGDVFGAGKGKKTHGYSALLRGNPTVTIEGDAKVRGSVYGGGEIASVGRYNVKKENDPDAPADVLVGMPYSLANSGSGYCTVIIQGNAEIGPATEMKMKTTSGIPDDTGHVIGGGKGVLPYDGYGVTDDDWIADPWRVSINDQKDIFNSTTYGATYEKEYFKYIETLALATETNVTISGNAFVKGSVYGGSLNGHVQHDTHVNIAGGQIGQGEGVTKGRYETADWASTSLAECPHWDYVANSGAPYDPLATTEGAYVYTNYDFVQQDDRKADSKGGLPVAKDGHTYYGNVFGGGSGVIPYAPGLWHRGAGSVGGDTYVNITGGHILSSVYGGNEHTDVGTYTKDASGQPTTTPAASNARGKCTVNMTGGTVGVPRTAAEKQAYPLVGNVFGAGKGDQRIFFNTWTNVINTEVNISGDARIYGSVFGGGEDGHIIGDAVTNIGNVTTKTGKGENDVEITANENANGLIIGTTGTSYSDGNVFGGGRGFSGEAQTAGTVGGNVEVNINAGSVYGSVYGGGRLASVGTMFEFPTLTDGSTNPAYGQFKEDETGANAKTYGHVTINISGGTIGNENATGDGAKYSGNVFGGSMGRLTLLNGDTNPIWPKMAQVKETNVNIYGTAVVRRSVYGGGELGTVRDNAYVTIGAYKTADADDDGNVAVTSSNSDSPTVRRDVYGGGYGSEDRNYTIFTVPELKSANAVPTDPASYESHTYAFTPMQFAGCVGKNTYVNVAGGYIRKNVYGGGELASVGVINYRAAEVTSEPNADKVIVEHQENTSKWTIYSNIVKHAPVKVNGKDVYYGFGLSWPYEFEYVDGYEGATHVKVTGGRLGVKDGDDDDDFDDNGDVYGAGKGQAGDYKDFVFCANVGSTDVVIDHSASNNLTSYSGTADLIAGAVYGGGEDGHVMGDTKVTMKSGFVYHSIYGGGSGKGKFDINQLKIGVDSSNATEYDYYPRKIYSITAGKVFGNTEVLMSGGMVFRNVYGGGNMGSVGKGNYSGGSDDYSEAGYGELPPQDNQVLWTSSTTGDNPTNPDFPWHFMHSGKCKVTITGGTVGYLGTSDFAQNMYPLKNNNRYDASLPYGNVFGGCRGESAPNITESPRYLYCPEFFVGYANETEVTIGKTDGSAGPTIKGSVYGGGMDGHVRRDASVTIYAGEIGETYDATKYDANYWMALGNVYGAGSGIGKYRYDFNYDNKIDDTVEGITYHGNSIKEEDFSTSAGSVTRFTKVEIQGGTIHRNVYGGGSLSSIGAPKIPASRTDNPVRRDDNATGTKGKQTLNEVVISGGQIGDANSYDTNGNHVYGGHVFGGSRGDASLDATKFSTSMFTSVTVNANATPVNSPIIKGSVFGGGEVGIVKGSVDVTLNGGTVEDDVYGGGALANTNTETSSDIPYTTAVNLTGGLIKGDAYGGGLGQKTGFNSATSDIAAVVHGDITVTLGTKKANAQDTNPTTATAFMTSYYTETGHTEVVKSGRVFGCNNLMGSPQGNVTVIVNKTVTGKDGSNNDLTRTDEDPDNTGVPKKGTDVTPRYEVAAVYGGGNLADYTATGKKTNVKIMTCDVSIRDVYGGGNAAKVPETDVLVKGAYEIQEVFGGGNGKDPYTNGITWTPNPGADVDGNANTLLTGGYIHEAYGGSNEKGTITGNVTIDVGTGGDCTLDVEKMVGAGKNADVNGDLIMILGCKPDTKIPLLYAGADNANVNGDVELTITSGRYGKVFGGNNKGGIIMGHIKLNIEETGNCETPIEIDELYLGGNEAMYSQYGYYNSGTPAAPVYEARTAEMAAITDPTATGYTPALTAEDYGGTEIRKTAPYDAPELNVISCTYIGKVFGGGYGTGAALYGNPTVKINMIPGSHANTSLLAKMTALSLPSTDNPNKLGIIGDVYGGGNAADVIGNPTVNIGTANVAMNTEPVHLGTSGYAYNSTTKKYEVPVVGAYITGNVFGGGMGKDDTFTCEKAMIGIDGDGVANPIGGTAVNIYKGTVLGSVYGGGEIGRVEKNTVVTIGNGDGVDATTSTPTSAPEIRGSVYGGGKGKETHGYSALVRGNPTVTVQGNAKVRGNVYGGGQIASVARYSVAKTDDEGAPYGVKKDEPYALKTNTSGFCTVTIKGYAEIGPETIGEEVKTTSVGHVFGAGKGILPGGYYKFVQGVTKRMVAVRDSEGHITGSTWETFTTEADYITFIKTLALSSQTNVTIDGNAKVKGSVFGGSESGFVQFDANVNVTGGTIGTQGKGGADFGNVYGGGKGDVEYTGTNHDYITAGIVKGNTKVVISQAEGKTTKILHNVYGGGAYGTVGEFEYDATTGMPTARKTYTVGTEVHNTTGGKAEIYITGGTIGTNGNENGMIFGSSRGDVGAPGSIHDKAAWVYDTHVAIGDTTATTTTTATPLIKGSVYGGGENGHNFHSSYVRINGGTIGITEGEAIGSYTAGGASYPYRGNVYGGGCGTDKYDSNNDDVEDSYNPLAGIIRGDATIRMTAGTVVHNMYGAGAMGSVGVKKTDGTVSGGTTTIDISGGTIGVSGTVGDGNVFGAARGDVDATSNAFALVRKTTGVSISGSALVKGNVYGGGELGCVGTYTITDGMRTFTWQDTDGTTNTPANSNNKNTGITNVTITGGTIGTGVDMSADGSFANGNVFGAGKGKDDTFWCEKGIVYKANVSVTAGTVKGNVYGGGEVGRVETDAVVKIGPDTETASPNINGNVFGGGAGVKTHGYSALVRGNTYVTVQSSAQVGHNVYGGGQIAAVGKYYLNDAGMPYSLVNDGLGICNVTVKGAATITGSVFGGGKGKDPENLDFAKPEGAESSYYHTTSYDIDDHMPKRMMNNYAGKNTYSEYYNPPTNSIIWEYFDTKEKYHTFLETLGLTTQSVVTIGGTRDATTGTVTSSGSPTINGNVYGGSESGFVQHNTDVTIAGGTIGTTTAGGDVFSGGLGLATFAEAGRVRGNATVTINAGTESGEPKIYHNVYGGGSLGDVGTIVKRADYNYKWTNADPSSIVLATPTTYPWNSTGVCTVTINGGTIGTGVAMSDDGTYANGNVFGAGKGLEDTWWCEKAMAYQTNVTITDGTINGTVYGGGQVGRVENNSTVTIGTENETGTGSKPNIIGNVFGAGAGVKTHGYSALVRGNSTVTVQGIAQVGKSVYGGGEIASVGKFTVVDGLPKHPDSGGTCTVTIQDHAKIGANGTEHNVFGACKGVTPDYHATGENRSKSMQLATNAPSDANLWSYCDANDHTYIWRYYPDEPAYRDFLETLALTSHPIVTIAEDATVNGSVFGGGERGITLGSVEVNMNGGTVTEDVYGGGSLANSNKGNWDGTDWATGKVVNGKTEYTTTVNLLGGTINNVYGGGLGDSNTPAIVYGDVKVNLNGLESDDYVEALHKTLVSDLDDSENTYYLANDGCIVTGNVFGCNNINGTPKGHAKVHVFKTKAKTDQAADGYDVAKVFGGGNAADYVPADTKQSTEVIIEGCDLTSIEEVYGGGYGAATPATSILVKGTKIIDNVYGGGYGAGDTNPGANVGYLTNGSAYTSGTGKAVVQLMAGTINNVYGGSNTKGDIRGGSSVTNVTNDKGPGCCDNLSVGEIYGGGKSADMFGGTEIILGCMPDDWIDAIYAGAESADVENDVSLTLTSGKFGRVFGGNKSGGKIDGSITVNLEENPECDTPLIIGEVYGGGNEAAYSAYGYGADGTPLTEAQARDAWTGEYPGGFSGPWVNAKAFTSIGNIYGGGYGASATVYGNPTVLINEVKYNTSKDYDVTQDTNVPDLIDGVNVKLYPHEAGEMGVIGNVFGGGNAADVIGNTRVEIGTGDSRYNTAKQAKVGFESIKDNPDTEEKENAKLVAGADIRGNVYGGGNNAQVTGDTNVVVGKKSE